jgi:hypothetical protein
MGLFMDNKKRVSDLNIEDFKDFPIWTWEDDDEYVIPIIEIETIPDDYNAVFVRCEITTHSDKSTIGVVSVRMSDHSIYVISFTDEKGKLLDIPLQPMLADRKIFQLNRLSNIMNKKTKEIFPLKFQTHFKFSDGTSLRGEIFL